jgi:hypothetical protein
MRHHGGVSNWVVPLRASGVADPGRGSFRRGWRAAPPGPPERQRQLERPGKLRPRGAHPEEWRHRGRGSGEPLQEIAVGGGPTGKGAGRASPPEAAHGVEPLLDLAMIALGCPRPATPRCSRTARTARTAYRPPSLPCEAGESTHPHSCPTETGSRHNSGANCDIRPAAGGAGAAVCGIQHQAGAWPFNHTGPCGDPASRRKRGGGPGPRGSGGLLAGRIARRRCGAAPFRPARGAAARFWRRGDGRQAPRQRCETPGYTRAGVRPPGRGGRSHGSRRSTATPRARRSWV